MLLLEKLTLHGDSPFSILSPKSTNAESNTHTASLPVYKVWSLQYGLQVQLTAIDWGQ